MLPFHKGERITTTAGGATLTGFSATVKGASADAPEAPRRKGGHLPYARFVTDSGRFGAVRYAALRPEELPGHQLRAGDVMVQRGTNHAWSNRSDAPCVIAFVLIDAEPIAGLDTH